MSDPSPVATPASATDNTQTAAQTSDATPSGVEKRQATSASDATPASNGLSSAPIVVIPTVPANAVNNVEGSAAAGNNDGTGELDPSQEDGGLDDQIDPQDDNHAEDFFETDLSHPFQFDGLDDASDDTVAFNVDPQSSDANDAVANGFDSDTDGQTDESKTDGSDDINDFPGVTVGDTFPETSLANPDDLDSNGNVLQGGQGKEDQNNDDGDVQALPEDDAVENDTDPDVASDQSSYEASLPTQTESAVSVDFTGAATQDECDSGCDADSPPIATFPGAEPTADASTTVVQFLARPSTTAVPTQTAAATF